LGREPRQHAADGVLATRMVGRGTSEALMPATTSAIILFAAMWALILYSAYRLFRWLPRHDREGREGRSTHDHGL